ncbi:MAG: hypothetical protein VR68_10845 [Peptococcaceae bacterium BRH_c4a]|nr:MAG: hypothetical protein VR68_10845 [Peptococcaceae bacterium BRH_c4a]
MQEREIDAVGAGKENSLHEEEQYVNDPPEDSGEAWDSGGGEGPEESQDQENLMELLTREKARSEDYFNRLARLQADFDNFRKRVAREREDLLKYAGEQVIASLLPIMDNFERALGAKNNDLGKLAEGVEMISRQIQDILTREGLEPIPSVGEQFNPEVHEAVMREENSDQPENTVIEEFRKGYTLKGKVIRPAMVKVAV